MTTLQQVAGAAAVIAAGGIVAALFLRSPRVGEHGGPLGPERDLTEGVSTESVAAA